jgi:hypothetical protein
LTRVGSDKLTIYVYPGPSKAWTDVTSSTGQLVQQFDPRWFNLTSAGIVKLQLQIVAKGAQSWQSSFGIGPTFSLDFNGAPGSALTSRDSTMYSGTYPAADLHQSPTPGGTQSVDPPRRETGLTGGPLAAAVVLPLLALAGIIIGYVGWSRRKSKSATRRWSSYVDNRLSQISQAQVAKPAATDYRASVLNSSRGSSAFPPPPVAARSMHQRGPSAISFSVPPALRESVNRPGPYLADSAARRGGDVAPDRDSAVEIDEGTIERIGRPKSANMFDDPSLQGESSVAILRGEDRLSRLDVDSAVGSTRSASTGRHLSVQPSLAAVEDHTGRREPSPGGWWDYDEEEEQHGEEELDDGDQADTQVSLTHGGMPRFAGPPVASPDGALAQYATRTSGPLTSSRMLYTSSQPGTVPVVMRTSPSRRVPVPREAERVNSVYSVESSVEGSALQSQPGGWAR